MNAPDSRVVVISGASNGIGSACAKRFAAAGCRVYDLSRHGADADGIVHITVDVTDETAVKSAFARVLADCGRIDVVIANAGFGISGAVEFTDSDAVRRLFDVNVLGAFHCAKAAAVVMRPQGGGHILFTGSIAGILSIPFQSFYSMTKAALNSLACAMANELRPYGVRVCALMLGDAKTGFTAKREKEIDGDAAYGGRISRSVERMERDEQGGMDPAVIAGAFWKASRRKNPKPIVAVGGLYKLFAALAALLPIRLKNAVLGTMYGK